VGVGMGLVWWLGCWNGLGWAVGSLRVGWADDVL
jgi:hypothetical protein